MLFRYLGFIARSVSVAFLLVAPWTSIFAQDGALDVSFGRAGKLSVDITGQLLDDAATSIVSLSEGRIMVAGTTSSGFPSEHDIAVTVLLQDGTIDQAFGQNGRLLIDQGANEYCQASAVQPDGHIILAGYRTPLEGGPPESVILRVHADGTIDRAFGSQGAAQESLPFAVVQLVLLPGGKILAAGTRPSAAGGDFAIACLDRTGVLSPGFGNGGVVIEDFGGDDYLTHLSLTPDGRLLAVGFDTAGLLDVARFCLDGSLDPTFGGIGKKTIKLGCFYDVAAATQLDGKILVGTTVEGLEMPDFLIARLMPDGTLDSSFGQEGIVEADLTGTDDYLTHLALQPDGKILAIGWAGFYPDFLVQRYNTDGSVDPSFGTNGWIHTDFVGDSDRARAVLVQPDGRFLLVGDVPGSNSDESRDFGLARYQFSSQPRSILEVMLAGIKQTPWPAASLAAELSDLWAATSQSRPQQALSDVMTEPAIEQLDLLARDEQVPTEWIRRMLESMTALANAVKQSSATPASSSLRRPRVESNRAQ
ncbi:MAG: hypothetical protein EHM61_21080 [Acidobacteria bacterium]|nr:MAG: hypothetical protein EHM61_21080 [Acidobacteriota bacterium]